jgi:tetratricopeptide (TPR) repeat protein
LLFVLTVVAQQASPAASSDSGLQAADQLYRSGKFAEAEAGYQALLKQDPNLVGAQVGLTRALLKQQKVDEAFDSVNAALAAHADSAALLAAKGEVQFRRGEMADAEKSYVGAKNLDAKEVHSYLGLARLYSAYSLYRKAYDQLEAAHTIAPDNIEVQRMWFGMLSRKERLAAMEAYLNGPHPDNEEDTNWMKEYVEFLKATVDKPVHRCHLVSRVEQTATRLEFMHGSDGHRVRGIGLTVKLNDRNARLLLDTGAGGILIGRKLAEKAGLQSISAQHIGGIGDKGLQSGYTAVADHIHIGELQFEDCIVRVSDNNSPGDEDGLIGADVFGSYLVDIDLPGMQFKLAPLPKRPEDTTAPTSLNSEGEEQARAEQKDAPADQKQAIPGQPASEQSKTEKQPVSAEGPKPPASRRLPKDRYIAPEMQNWTKVFHFGHTILIPTLVNDNKPMLFGLDTGAFANILSVRAGRQIGKVSTDDSIKVRGLNGQVKQVYSSNKATLQFGHLRQTNMDMVTLDLSSLSRRTGTEISGFLGFNMLRLLELKIDYRDGLVDFIYDPNRRTLYMSQ